MLLTPKDIIKRLRARADELGVKDPFSYSAEVAAKELCAIAAWAEKELTLEAKAAVKAAKQSVGEFKFVQPKRGPGYNSEGLLRVVIDHATESSSSWPSLLGELYDRGVVKGFLVDKDVAKVIHDSGNEVAQAIEEAWSEGGEDPSAQVKAPKV